MSIEKFKEDLHNIIDNQGSNGLRDVFQEIKDCSYLYDKTMLTELRNNAIDENSSYKFLTRVKLFIDSICESNSQNAQYFMESIDENPIFKKFIFLNRQDEFSDLRHFCKRVKDSSSTTKVYQVRAKNCHRADWLFDRLRVHLETEKDSYFHNNMRIHRNLNFRDFIADLKARNNGIIIRSNEHILSQLPSEKFHLLPFVIDAEEENKRLDEFIQGFYDFWENTPLCVDNYVVLLAVNIRNRKFSLWRKLTGNKSALHRKPDIMELSPISKDDVKTLFEDELKCGHLIHDVKKEKASIEDFWRHLHPLIYKITMKR